MIENNDQMKKTHSNINLLIAGLLTFTFGLNLAHAQTIKDNEEIVNDTIVENQDSDIYNENDYVNIGFKTIKKTEVVGAVSSIKPDEFSHQDNSQWVRSAIEGKILGVRGSDNIRGIGNALLVVDGIPGRNIDHLNMDEIEQITVLKDANAIALYGTQGRNGAIIITTKSGKASEKTAKITINQSIRKPIALPQYVGSVEYMQLFNEARANDGLAPVYSAEDIENYRPDINPYKYSDVDLYSNEYLKKYNQSTDVIAQFSGGISDARYYVNMGWNADGSLEKLNPEANRGVNRFNFRGNINFRVNKFIKSSVGVFSVVNTNRVAHVNAINQGEQFKPNGYAPLIPVYLVDSLVNPELAGQLIAANTFEDYLLGSTQAYNTNAPVANILGGGYRKYMFRTTQFNNNIDFDLGGLLKGLSAQTYLSFDFYDAYTISINNDYAVYEPTWEGNKIIALQKFGVDQKDLSENVSTRDFISRYGFYGLLNYSGTFGEDHNLNTSLIGYTNSTMFLNNSQKDKNSHLGLQVSYMFQDKLLADFSSAYVYSIKLPENNRGAFSPTLGLAYVLSEEIFIENISQIDYLKLRASTGIVNSDLSITDYFIYEQIYQNPGGYFNWADQYNNKITQLVQGANPELSFEKRKDINLGFEALIMNQLWVEFNAFNSHIVDIVTAPTTQYPSFYDNFKPYDNYNAEKFQGFELGINYKRKIGSIDISVGSNILYTKTERTVFDEVNLYEYQNKEGKPVDAIFGLEDDGFYSTSDFNPDGTLSSGQPKPSFGDSRPGDIKYIDQNNDNIIDDDDKIMIGKWNNPWTYSFNINVGYKGFNLFVLGVGQYGGNSNITNNYYWIDGNDKYSVIAKERWTPETAEQAKYPRLSASNNSNNYRTSTFWMYNNSFFKIARTQLSYSFSKRICDKIRMKNLSINISATNLLELAENVEIRQLNIGSSPQYRSFTVGLRTTL